jgi:hypothetical protein
VVSDVAEDHRLYKYDNQNEYHRGNIDSPKRWQKPPDWPQRWLGDGIQEGPYVPSELVSQVDSVKGDEPRHYGLGNNDPDVKLK